uniref:Centromere-associated protein E-like n=1 Tax=Saccoglossus kowalevskii TaxID=10224 RepID=A0ABM0LVC7_SACKO|nr:PREDICTED: centromere-associated protein E-like [Saccoglossus kowalevskii]
MASEKPTKSSSFTTETQPSIKDDESVSRETKSHFNVRPHHEEFADDRVISPKVSSPSTNLSAMFLSQHPDLSDVDDDDDVNEEILKVTGSADGEILLSDDDVHEYRPSAPEPMDKPVLQSSKSRNVTFNIESASPDSLCDTSLEQSLENNSPNSVSASSSLTSSNIDKKSSSTTSTSSTTTNFIESEDSSRSDGTGTSYTTDGTCSSYTTSDASSTTGQSCSTSSSTNTCSGSSSWTQSDTLTGSSNTETTESESDITMVKQSMQDSREPTACVTTSRSSTTEQLNTSTKTPSPIPELESTHSVNDDDQGSNFTFSINDESLPDNSSPSMLFKRERDEVSSKETPMLLKREIDEVSSKELIAGSSSFHEHTSPAQLEMGITQGFSVSPVSFSSSVEAVIDSDENVEIDLSQNVSEELSNYESEDNIGMYTASSKLLQRCADREHNENPSIASIGSFTSPSQLAHHVLSDESEDNIGMYTAPSKLLQRCADREHNENPSIASIGSFTSPSQIIMKEEETNAITSGDSSSSLESRESMTEGIVASAPTITLPYDSELDVADDFRAVSIDAGLTCLNSTTLPPINDTQSKSFQHVEGMQEANAERIPKTFVHPESASAIPVYTTMVCMPAGGDLHKPKPEYMRDFITQALAFDKGKHHFSSMIPKMHQLSKKYATTQQLSEDNPVEKSDEGETVKSLKELAIQAQYKFNHASNESVCCTSFGAANIIEQQTEEIHRLVWELYREKCKNVEQNQTDNIPKDVQKECSMCEIRDMEIKKLQEEVHKLREVSTEKNVLHLQQELEEMKTLAEERLEHIHMLKDHFMDGQSSREGFVITESDEAVPEHGKYMVEISSLKSELEEAKHIIDVKNRHIEVLLQSIQQDSPSPTQHKVNDQDDDFVSNLKDELKRKKEDSHALEKELYGIKKLAEQRLGEINTLLQKNENKHDHHDKQEAIIQNLLQQVKNLIMIVDGKDGANDVVSKKEEGEQLIKHLTYFKNLSEVREQELIKIERKLSYARQDKDQNETESQNLKQQIHNLNMIIDQKDTKIANLHARSIDRPEIKSEAEAGQLDQWQFDKLAADIEQLQKELIYSKKLAETRQGEINILQRKISYSRQDTDAKQTSAQNLIHQINNLKTILEQKDTEIEHIKLRFRERELPAGNNVLTVGHEMEIKENNKEIEALEKELTSIKSLADQRSQDIILISRKHSDAKQSIDENQTLALNLQHQIKNLKMAMEMKESELSKLQDTLHQTEKDLQSSNQASMNMTKQQNDLKEQIEHLTQQFHQAIHINNRQEFTIKSLHGELQNETRRNAEKETEINKLVEDLQMKLFRTGENNSMDITESVVTSLQNDLAETRRLKTEKEMEMATLKIELVNEKHTLQEEMEGLKYQLEKTKSLLDDQINTNSSLENQLENLRKKDHEQSEKIILLVKKHSDEKQHFQKEIDALKLQLASSEIKYNIDSDVKTSHEKAIELARTFSKDKHVQLKIMTEESQKHLHEIEQLKLHHKEEMHEKVATIASLQQELRDAKQVAENKEHQLQLSLNAHQQQEHDLEKEITSLQMKVVSAEVKHDMHETSDRAASVQKELQAELQRVTMEDVGREAAKDVTIATLQQEVKDVKNVAQDKENNMKQVIQDSHTQKQELQKVIDKLELQLVTAEAKHDMNTNSNLHQKEIELARKFSHENHAQLQSITKETQTHLEEVHRDMEQLKLHHNNELHNKDILLATLQQELKDTKHMLEVKEQQFQVLVKDNQKEQHDLEKQIHALELEISSAEVKHEMHETSERTTDVQKQLELARKFSHEKNAQLQMLKQENQNKLEKLQAELQRVKMEDIGREAAKDVSIAKLQQELKDVKHVVKVKDNQLTQVTNESKRKQQELQKVIDKFELQLVTAEVKHGMHANSDLNAIHQKEVELARKFSHENHAQLQSVTKETQTRLEKVHRDMEQLKLHHNNELHQKDIVIATLQQELRDNNHMFDAKKQQLELCMRDSQKEQHELEKEIHALKMQITKVEVEHEMHETSDRAMGVQKQLELERKLSHEKNAQVQMLTQEFQDKHDKLQAELQKVSMQEYENQSRKDIHIASLQQELRDTRNKVDEKANSLKQVIKENQIQQQELQQAIAELKLKLVTAEVKQDIHSSSNGDTLHQKELELSRTISHEKHVQLQSINEETHRQLDGLHKEIEKLKLSHIEEIHDKDITIASQQQELRDLRQMAVNSERQFQLSINENQKTQHELEKEINALQMKIVRDEIRYDLQANSCTTTGIQKELALAHKFTYEQNAQIQSVTQE